MNFAWGLEISIASSSSPGMDVVDTIHACVSSATKAKNAMLTAADS